MRWNWKKLVSNILKLVVLGLMYWAIFQTIVGIDRCPTIQYHEFVEDGGTWQEWADNNL